MTYTVTGNTYGTSAGTNTGTWNTDYDYWITTDSATANTNWIVYTATWTAVYPTSTSPAITVPLSNYEDPVEELKKRCLNLEEWYAEKLSQLIGKIEENEYEIDDLKDEIRDLKITIKKLVDILTEAALNER